VDQGDLVEAVEPGFGNLALGDIQGFGERITVKINHDPAGSFMDS
jgi:hypothetical protein